jgi:hypothetical protein
MGLTREQVTKVRTAAAIHDVAKLKTPREILNKPGMLTDEEFAAVRRHPADGAELAADMGDPELTAMVRYHHERLDGRGYPEGLRANEIPLGARIIAVADTFDAITSTRPYRAGAKHKTALDILRKEAGSQLDPAAVGAFLGYYSGRRSVAWWSVLVAEPPRVIAWLVGWVQGAGATPIAKGLVAAGASALIGTTLMSPPAPQASIIAKGAPATVAQRHADRAGSDGNPPAGQAPREPGARGSSGGRSQSPPPRRRSGSSGGSSKRSGSDGHRPAPISDDTAPEAGSGGGSRGGSGSDSGGDDAAGGSSGGGDDPGTGPGTGSQPVPLATPDAAELPPLPADVPLPEIQTPQLPPLPVTDSLPQVELPPLNVAP